MSVKIEYAETHVNTVYINYDLEYKGKQYYICVDWAGGIQDIEIMDKNDAFSDYESLYTGDLDMSAKDRLEIIEVVKEALTQTDFNSNVTFSS